MKREKLLALSNAICFIIAFLVSMLSQRKIFGRNTIGDISKKYDTLFTPADITFSIWGLIYISLFAFCIYHLIAAFRKDADEEANVQLRQIGWLFVLNNMATTLWVVAWVNEMVILSVLLMIIQLVTLVFICKQAHIFNKERSLSSKIFTQIPISIYFGWISVAIAVNVNAAFKAFGWDTILLSAKNQTIILIGIMALVSILVIMVKKNVFYGMVIIWAFYGIILKNRDIAGNEEIITASAAAMALVGLTSIIELYKLIKPLSEPVPASVHSRNARTTDTTY
ncbi:MAG TPA: hypothetical protein VNI52_10960 [Sphingobacteriaceae bacterium]|nr:hypothetical protein [Sphingobacteriaceae bacterium]